MEQYQKHFIDFLVKAAALKFGSFKLKSGRISPYFLNMGMLNSGRQLLALGSFYANAISQGAELKGCNVLFGAAYKGIPLASVTALQLENLHGISSSICFNRKETKDHGEGGVLVGYKPVPGDCLVLIDDVITAGTATRESVNILRKECPGAIIMGQVIAVDRMERGQGDLSAIQEIKKEFGFSISAIVTLDDIVKHLYGKNIDGTVILNDEMFQKIAAYRDKYGAKN